MRSDTCSPSWVCAKTIPLCTSGDSIIYILNVDENIFDKVGKFLPFFSRHILYIGPCIWNSPFGVTCNLFQGQYFLCRNVRIHACFNCSCPYYSHFLFDVYKIPWFVNIFSFCLDCGFLSINHSLDLCAAALIIMAKDSYRFSQTRSVLDFVFFEFCFLFVTSVRFHLRHEWQAKKGREASLRPRSHVELGTCGSLRPRSHV